LLFVALYEKTKKLSYRSLCLLASMNKNLIFTTPAPLSSPIELDYHKIKAIYLYLFNEKNNADPLWHVYKFPKRYEGLSVCDVSNDISKAKLFHHTLQGEFKEWVIKWHKKSSWSNIRFAFIEIFGDPKVTAGMKGTIIAFKQRKNETLTEACERFIFLIKIYSWPFCLDHLTLFLLWFG
jgi:hypothetical protein